MTVKDLADKMKALGAFLSKSGSAIPEPELRKASDMVQSLDDLLGKFRPLAKADMDAAKSLGISAQIIQFTSMGKGRTTFFDQEYFKRKFEALAPDRATVLSFVKKGSAKEYLAALLLYHYWAGRPEGDLRLREFLKELQSDYNNSPAVKQADQAKTVLKDLLRESDANVIEIALREKYPSSTELGAFAKMTNLKVQKEGTAKKAPKKSAHTRLAEQILKESALIRMKLE